MGLSKGDFFIVLAANFASPLMNQLVRFAVFLLKFNRYFSIPVI